MALTLVPKPPGPLLPAGGEDTTRPRHRGGGVSGARPRVLGAGGSPCVSTPGARGPPAGAGTPAAPGQRTRRLGRREQGTGRRDAPARGPGRWGPPDRPAVAHVRRGHAASSPAPASRGGNGDTRRQPGPPGRPGPASAPPASRRRPHLPAHVQQRVIVFIVQLLLAQGRRHLRNLSPRQTGRPCSRGTGGRRRAQRERPGGATAAPGGPEARRRRRSRRASSAPAPCAPARPRAGAAPGAPPRAARAPRAQPGRASSVRGRPLTAGNGRLCSHSRWRSPSGRRGDRPLQHRPASLAGSQRGAHPLPK